MTKCLLRFRQLIISESEWDGCSWYTFHTDVWLTGWWPPGKYYPYVTIGDLYSRTVLYDEHYSHCLNRSPCDEGTGLWTYKHWKFWFNEVRAGFQCHAAKRFADRIMPSLIKDGYPSLHSATWSLKSRWCVGGARCRYIYLLKTGRVAFLVNALKFPGFLTGFLMIHNHCVLSESHHWRNLYFHFGELIFPHLRSSKAQSFDEEIMANSSPGTYDDSTERLKVGFP